nr:hypothetical protein [Candidatus Woesebacteria bacterium]
PVTPIKTAEMIEEEIILRKISPDTNKKEPINNIKKEANTDLDLSPVREGQSDQGLQQKKNIPASPIRPTIKNKSGVQNMLKMILITIGVFCATVAIGVGVALAFLKFSGASKETTETPIVEVQATPAPTPTPEATATPVATASATTVPKNAKILIVNATTKAGYAGTFKSKIEAAKIGTVTAANAKEKYTKGFVAYMKTENAELLASVEKATGLSLTIDKKAAAEDTQNKYDLVLVLAE